MRISEVMTQDVVSAPRDATLQQVAELMRDRQVGCVVIADSERPCALITDRDVALALGAADAGRDDAADAHASRPLVTGHVDMDVEEAAALMVQHGVRRLPVISDNGAMQGIATLDDLAIRTGDLKLAQQITADVARAALPQFYFHQRGG